MDRPPNRTQITARISATRSFLEGLAVSDVTARHDCQRDQENAINHAFATTQIRKQLKTRATLERVLADPSEPETSTTETTLVTDAELARARQNLTFDYRLAAEALELLLREHNRLRALGADRTHRKQMYEAVDLAIKLLDLLQRTAPTKNARCGA